MGTGLRRAFACFVAVSLWASGCSSGSGDDPAADRPDDDEAAATDAVINDESIELANVVVADLGSEEAAFAAIVAALERGYEPAVVLDAIGDSELVSGGFIMGTEGEPIEPSNEPHGLVVLPATDEPASATLPPDPGAPQQLLLHLEEPESESEPEQVEEPLPIERLREQAKVAAGDLYGKASFVGHAAVAIILDLLKRGATFEDIVNILVLGPDDARTVEYTTIDGLTRSAHVYVIGDELLWSSRAEDTPLAEEAYRKLVAAETDAEAGQTEGSSNTGDTTGSRPDDDVLGDATIADGTYSAHWPPRHGENSNTIATNHTPIEVVVSGDSFTLSAATSVTDQLGDACKGTMTATFEGSGRIGGPDVNPGTLKGEVREVRKLSYEGDCHFTPSEETHEAIVVGSVDGGVITIDSLGYARDIVLDG